MSPRRPAPSLVRLDAALLGLRRFVEAPSARPWIQHGAARVEVSTMLVVDAVARTPGAVASVGDVAEVLRVAHSTASRLVERAVGADMVTRERAADDPRRVELRLTAAGADLQTAAVGFRTDRLAAMVGDWPVADIDTLTILLERLSVAFHNDGYTEREGSGPG